MTRLLLFAALSAVSASPLRAADDPAAKTEVPAQAEAPAKPATAIPEIPPSTEAKPAAAPDRTPAAAAAAPAPQPAAPAPAPAPAPAQDVITAATYTRDVAKMYEDLARDARDFTAKSHQKLLTFKKDEDDLQGQIDQANSELSGKSADASKEAKKAVKELNKKVAQLSKQLKAAKKETARQTSNLLQALSEMRSRHLEAIQSKYVEVEGEVKAAE